MTRTFLAIASLMLIWAVSGSSNAQSTQAKEPILPEGSCPQKVAGVGETEEAARQDAYRKAVRMITNLMEQQDPPLHTFRITKDYVGKYLLVDEGSAGMDILLDLNMPFKQWILTFRTDTNWWKDIVYLDQQAERKIHAETRQGLTSRLMLGLSVLLLAGFGYVRLDQVTHYRYTRWLRVVGVGAVSLLLAGGYWFLQAG